MAQLGSPFAISPFRSAERDRTVPHVVSMPAPPAAGPAPAIHAMLAALAPSPDPVFVTNRHNRVVFWNASTQRMLGFDERDVLGTSCAALLHGCDRLGNRYCDDCCPILQMATRGELIRRRPGAEADGP